jgi:outer membrane protein
MRMGWTVALAIALVTGTARSDVLTADRAVQLALQHSTQVVQARAGVLQARSSAYSTLSEVLPHVSLGISRSGTWSPELGSQVFGSSVSPPQSHFSSYRTTPSLSASMEVLNLGAIQGVRAGNASLRAASLRQSATNNDVALDVRQQFYTAVNAIHLIGVNTEALRVARENERRVHALFEVGSVSRSDVLQAQVQTEQSQLDSLTAAQQALNQRIALASLIGVEEGALGELDTTLVVAPQPVDEAAILAEAARERPDIRAAEASVIAGRSALSAAHLARVPSISVNGTAFYGLKNSSGWNQDIFRTVAPDTVIGGHVVHQVEFVPDARLGSNSRTDREYQATISLNWNIFDGLLIESRIASARANLATATATRDQLRRNLAGEVHQAVVAYDQAIQQEAVAETQLASSAENLKLTQQKYNVGSATILELNTAQVTLQRARSQRVTAQAAVRVAEAQIAHVRGRNP